MEFFSDRWALWACFFVPAFVWLYAGMPPRRKLPFTRLAAVVAIVSGGPLVLAGVHAFVNLVFDLIRLLRG